MDITVAVATFGDRVWAELARARAIPSAHRQDVPTLHVHGETLQVARNELLDKVRTPYICYLDADDELEPGYMTEIRAHTADLRVPHVRYVRDGLSDPVRMPHVAGHDHACTADCLTYGNWLVIGTVAPTQLIRDVGGWRDFTWSEDYDVWVRCWQAGATIAPTQAVYRAHVRDDSRNRGPERAERLAQHQAIARANNLPVPA